MRVAYRKGAVAVSLSRKNLLALLKMLDDNDKGAPALIGRDLNTEIVVVPEEDAVHYTPDRPAGLMSWEAGT